MAVFYSYDIPIHDECMISYPYGIIDSGYSCGWHTGVDLVPHGSTENYPLLYGCVPSGTVVYVNYTNTGALGVQVQFVDSANRYWRYCHMQIGSVSLSVGDPVDYNTVIGRMRRYWKCNWKAFTFRMLYNSSLAMCYIFKSM